MKIICGLGNPGKAYERSRHNTGFMFLEAFAKKYDFPKFEPRGKAELAGKSRGSEKILLMRPLTFMNLSGEAVHEVLNFYKVKPSDFYLVYDDADLPLGVLRFREKGSAGTHNGVRSVIECLGTIEFPRLRIGIESRGETAPERLDLHDFVLAPFLEAELPVLEKAIEEGIEILEKSLASE